MVDFVIDNEPVFFVEHAAQFFAEGSLGVFVGVAIAVED